MSGSNKTKTHHLRWAVVDWATHYDSGEPAAWRRDYPEVERAHRLLILLAMICDLPSGEISDYSYADWAHVMGITEEQALEAADILSAWEVSWRTGELDRSGAGTHCLINIPPNVLARAETLATAFDA